jgi:hypothetical protein
MACCINELVEDDRSVENVQKSNICPRVIRLKSLRFLRAKIRCKTKCIIGRTSAVACPLWGHKPKFKLTHFPLPETQWTAQSLATKQKPPETTLDGLGLVRARMARAAQGRAIQAPKIPIFRAVRDPMFR